MTTPSERPLRLLSLDGGGVKGLTSLLILREIFRAIEIENGQPVRPHEWFDVIAGTSTGGLIAIMLGRLQMSIEDCINIYKELSLNVFIPRNRQSSFFGIKYLAAEIGSSWFEGSRLEAAVKSVLKERGMDEDVMLREDLDPKCKVFVCSARAHTTHCECLRSYVTNTIGQQNHDCTVVEAARATTAAPVFFEPVTFKASGATFVDGAIRANNPIDYLMNEVEGLWPGRPLGCIISIGTGVTRINPLRTASPRLHEILVTLSQITADAANKARDFLRTRQGRELQEAGKYFRFSVEQGMDDVNLADPTTMPWMESMAVPYLEEKRREIELCARNMVNPTAVMTALTDFSNLPSLAVSYFVRRKGPLEAIEARFDHVEKTHDDAIVVTLVGMGGSGKTQIAAHYCKVAEASRRYKAVLWVDASTLTALSQSFVTLSEEMSRGTQEFRNIAERISFVKDTLSQQLAPWLIVFDNFDKPSKAIKDYFPKGGRGAIIITSRDKSTTSLGSRIAVGRMTEDEALDLLLRRAECDRTEDNVRSGEEITQELGCLALGIDQAGAYINYRNLPLQQYLVHFRSRKKRVLKEVPSELWEYTRKLGETDEISLSVLTTWELSFELIGNDSDDQDVQRHVYTLSGFFDNKKISGAIFQSIFKSEKPESQYNSMWGEPEFRSSFESEKPEWMPITLLGAWSYYRFQDVLAKLHRLSLLEALSTDAEGSYSFSLHPLVRDWVQLRLSREEQRFYTLESTLILCEYIFQHEDNLLMSEKQETLSHLDAVVRNNEEYVGGETGLGFGRLREVAGVFGRFYSHEERWEGAEKLLDRVLETSTKDCGTASREALAAMAHLGAIYCGQERWKEAEEMGRQAVEGLKNLLGEDDVFTLDSMCILASALQSQGRYEEAAALLRPAVEGTEKALGPCHPDTLKSINNLGLVLEKQGKYEAAEAMNLRVMEGLQMELGNDHQMTLTSMNNLAMVMQSQGKYDEAEAMHRRVLQAKEKAVQGQHASKLVSMSNLGEVLRKQGKLEAAEGITRQVLDWSKKLRGNNHSQTLVSMGNLAGILEHRGKYAEAEELFRQELEVEKRVMGDDHPQTLATMTNLSGVLNHRGKYGLAEEICRQALDGSKRVLGDDHPRTLTTMGGLALVMQRQGKYEDAEEMHRQAFTMKTKVLGEQHPETIGSMNNLAELLRECGKPQEAKELNRRVLEGARTAVGDDHPNTLTSMNNMGLTLQSQGRHKEAEDMFRQALEGIKKVVGDDGPQVLMGKNNLAISLMSQGKHEAAEKLFREGLGRCEKIVGEDHLYALANVDGLAHALQSQGKYTEAEKMHRRALTIREKLTGKDHVGTAASMDGLAETLQRQGRYAEAENMYRLALATKERLLGENHMGTIDSMGCLATTLASQGKYEASLAMQKRVLNRKTRALGDDHPQTLFSVNYVASECMGLGLVQEAESLFAEGLEKMKRVLGPDHPATKNCVEGLEMIGRMHGWFRAVGAPNAQAPETGSRAFGPQHLGVTESPASTPGAQASPRLRGIDKVFRAAAARGKEALAQRRLKDGANVNAAGEDGSTALHLAAANGHVMVVRMLVEQEADIEVADGDGRTALRRAEDNEHREVVQVLLEKGFQLLLGL